MLKLTVFEFIARTLPESFLVIFAMVVLCNIKLKWTRYLVSSLLFAISQLLIRMLPINYGVHTILGLFVTIVILALINKSDVILTIKASMIVVITLFICEGINMILLNIMFKGNIEKVISNPVLKTIFGFPSLVLFMIILSIYYLVKRKLEINARYK